jgi:hypothetical protein
LYVPTPAIIEKGTDGIQIPIKLFFFIFLSTLNSAKVLEQSCGGGIGDWGLGGGVLAVEAPYLI